MIPKLAAPGCKACHGTGIYGTRINQDKSRTVLVCACVAKAMAKR